MVNPFPADRRAQWVTDVVKVKSHLEDVGPSVVTQNKIGFHHVLANSLADVVAEEAAKRLLLDLNLECKAKKAELIGIGVAKSLALVQADIWAKRGAARDIYDLEPLLAVEETCTRSAIGKLEDELAQQGHLLVRHNKGLQRKDRQFNFWNRASSVPRLCAADVICQFRNKQRQHNAYTGDSACGKSVFPTVGSCATSAPTRRHETSDVEGGQGTANLTSKGDVGFVTSLAQVGGKNQRDRFSLSVSELEGDVAHTQQFCVCIFFSQVGEQCDGSRYVSAQSLSRCMDDKSRKLESAKGVVNTPIFDADERVVSPETQTKVDSDDPDGPRAPLRSSFDDPEDWELSCSDGESVCWDEAHRMEPVACRPIIKCGTTGCTGPGTWVYSLQEAGYVRALWEDRLGFSECFVS